MKITKEQFEKSMNDIKAQCIEQRNFNSALQPFFDDMYGGCTLGNDLADSYIRLLTELTNDTGHINYFIWDCDFGAGLTGNVLGKVVTKDRKEFILRTIDDLWELLNHESGINKERNK